MSLSNSNSKTPLGCYQVHFSAKERRRMRHQLTGQLQDENYLTRVLITRLMELLNKRAAEISLSDQIKVYGILARFLSIMPALERAAKSLNPGIEAELAQALLDAEDSYADL